MAQVFKRCGCRDEHGKQLGPRCRDLTKRSHGTWAFVVDIAREGDPRKQVKRSGFATKKDAEAELERVISLAREGVSVDGGKMTTGEWLDFWLKDRTAPIGSLGASQLRPSTAYVYKLHISYLKPHLGNVPLANLRSVDISNAYKALAEESSAKAAEAAERLAEANEERVSKGLEPLPEAPVKRIGATSLRRIHACLKSALSAAVRAGHIRRNPALGVVLPSEVRPQLKPWEASQLGAFLDHVQGHRLGVLFEALAATGLRRGEALGLRWSDVDLSTGTVAVRRQLLNSRKDGQPVYGPPKTAAGERTVDLPSRTLEGLRAHRVRQDAERSRWREAYEDSGLVFCQENGRALDPARISKVFASLAAEAGLPHVRLHDLRHGSASLLMAAGVPLAVVSKRLGHSSISVTSDVYGHLLDGVGRSAAEAAMDLVPRNGV